MGHTDALVHFVGGKASDRWALVGPVLGLCTEGLPGVPWVGASWVGTPQPALPLPHHGLQLPHQWRGRGGR